MTDLVHSELLCVLQNHMQDYERDILLNKISNFYTTDEISRAKSLLFTFMDKIDPSEKLKAAPPKLVIRRGDAKSKSDTSDILDLLEYITNNKLDMPIYYSINLQRIPTFSGYNTESSEVFIAVKNKVSGMEAALGKLTEMVSELYSNRPQHFPSTSAPPVMPKPLVLSSQWRPPQSDYCDPIGSTNPDGSIPLPSRSYAAAVGPAKLPDRSWGSSSDTPIHVSGPAQQVFTMVNHKKVRRSVAGLKSLSSDSMLKVVPRKVTVFIGRLDKETSVDNVTEFLRMAGAEVSSCKKLSGTAKSGREFQSAAFMVTCEARFEQILFDANTWPLDCSVREWFFNPTTGQTTKP